ncbi:MAG: YdjY domain-containing protein, partial [Pirellulaceae bacterium]|nr:YdjY domain-containing protein [Pirellulaceae bacterium]
MILNHQEHRKKPAGLLILWAALTMPCVALCAAEPTAEALSTNRPGAAGDATNATLQAALQKLNLPGVAINVQERCVDVESSVCLHRGALELVACTKGTKEHESIVAIKARPVHIHLALLLLGAEPGSPATRQQLGDLAERWIDVPPSGGPVDVFLVFKGKEGKIVEHPISDFIAPSSKRSDDSASADQEAKFPTHTF